MCPPRSRATGLTVIKSLCPETIFESLVSVRGASIEVGSCESGLFIDGDEEASKFEEVVCEVDATSIAIFELAYLVRRVSKVEARSECEAKVKESDSQTFVSKGLARMNRVSELQAT